jgi:cadmium resistance protein CadD (predicted permease)
MNSMLAIIPVTAAAYVATNLDNFLLLVALLGRYRQHTANVVAGFFACTLIFALVALWIGMAANFMPVQYLGFLGFVPVAMGVYELIRLRRGSAHAVEAEKEAVNGGKKIFITTLSSQLANGTDTVVVFSVLFIDSAPSADVLTILTIVAMAFVFACAAVYAVGHAALGQRIDRYAHRVMPFVLIIVGLYVVANTATDLMPG